jgi:hypothetical protein
MQSFALAATRADTRIWQSVFAIEQGAFSSFQADFAFTTRTTR